MNEREKWLVIQGFIAGYGAAGVEPPYSKRVSDLAKRWLDDCVADGVTVEMLLDKEMQDGDEMSEPTLRDEFALSAPAEPWPEFEPVMSPPPSPPPVYPVADNGDWPAHRTSTTLLEWRFGEYKGDVAAEFPEYSHWISAWRDYRVAMADYSRENALQRRIQWPYWYADQMMAERDRKR